MDESPESQTPTTTTHGNPTSTTMTDGSSITDMYPLRKNPWTHTDVDYKYKSVRDLVFNNHNVNPFPWHHNPATCLGCQVERALRDVLWVRRNPTPPDVIARFKAIADGNE